MDHMTTGPQQATEAAAAAGTPGKTALCHLSDHTDDAAAAAAEQ